MTHTSSETILETALPYSRFAQRLLESEPHLRTSLVDNLSQPYLKEDMQAFLNSHVDDNLDELILHRALRTLRKQVFLRIAVRDLVGLADLSEVVTSITNLAEVTINFALKHHQNWLTDPNRFGLPIGKDSNTEQHLLVVAMGKLGGRELNVSSDVDLIFVYPEDGETNGTKPISNQCVNYDTGRNQGQCPSNYASTDIQSNDNHCHTEKDIYGCQVAKPEETLIIIVDHI